MFFSLYHPLCLLKEKYWEIKDEVKLQNKTKGAIKKNEERA